MSKRFKILISVAIIVVLAVVAVVIFGSSAVQKITNQNNGHPIPATSTPTPKVVQDLTTTTQFKEAASSQYANYLVNSNLGNSTPPALSTLSAYTVNNYIQGAITKPYFVSGYWGTKDSYRAASLETYVTPYLSPDLQKEFVQNAADPNSATFKDYFAARVYMPSSDLTISPQCYDTWQTDYCFATPTNITNMTFTGISATQVKVTATVDVNVIYQKPNAPEGDLISQDRNYNLTFTLSETNPPKTVDAKLPIMTIDAITASLDIKGTSDYLINQGG